MSLGEEISSLITAGVHTVHLDVMDNHYVPNLTFGPHIALGIKQRFPQLNIDVHLMTTPVDSLIEQFAKAGATRISIHPDATIHLDRSLNLIHSLGCKAGIVLNPSTSLDTISWCAHHLDFVLVMTVNPGFGGQSLIPAVIPKIKQLHIAYPSLNIVVDGGINPENIAELARAGATEYVVGSALFNTTDYSYTLNSFCQPLNNTP